MELDEFIVLRAIAEGRIKWGFYPPDYDLANLPENNKGLGIWIDGSIEDDITGDEDHDDEGGGEDSEDSGDDSVQNGTHSEEDESEEEGSSEGEKIVTKLATGPGMFSALAMDDD